MKMPDSPGARDVVQIFSADETKLYATVIGIPTSRLDPPDKAEITFYEREPGLPLTVREWFYPGYTSGVEFVYPNARGTELAKAAGQHAAAPPAHQPTSN
jgi:hypothetical protein